MYPIINELKPRWSICWSVGPSVGPSVTRFGIQAKKSTNFHQCPCPTFATDMVVYPALFFKLRKLSGNGKESPKHPKDFCLIKSGIVYFQQRIYTELNRTHAQNMDLHKAFFFHLPTNLFMESDLQSVKATGHSICITQTLKNIILYQQANIH